MVFECPQKPEVSVGFDMSLLRKSQYCRSCFAHVSSSTSPSAHAMRMMTAKPPRGEPDTDNDIATPAEGRTSADRAGRRRYNENWRSVRKG